MADYRQPLISSVGHATIVASAASVPAPAPMPPFPAPSGAASLPFVPAPAGSGNDESMIIPATEPPPNYFGGTFALPGYEDVQYGRPSIVGPAPSFPPPEYAETPAECAAFRDISADEARDALVEKVRSECCWGDSPARECAIVSLQSNQSFHVALETFVESRTTERACVPYHCGDRVDGPQAGVAPGPWDIPLDLPQGQLFVNNVVKIRIPHTDVVEGCFVCQRRGRVRCHSCGGSGHYSCSSCSGSGRVTRSITEMDSDGVVRTVTTTTSCSSCSGSGTSSCSTCDGSGSTTCSECLGAGMLRWYIQLAIHRVNKIGDEIVTNSTLPTHIIQHASGMTVLNVVGHCVRPCTLSSEDVNDASRRLLASVVASPVERLLQQRLTVRTVPVVEIGALYKNKPFRFWVYGQEHSVYSPDYPSQCCGCCNVM